MVTLADIQAARVRMGDLVDRTPCDRSQTFSALTGNSIFFKLENLQMTGSFKERGALNKMLLLSDAERARGVICASAGNHAQGVSYHATRLGIRSKIVMPLTAPLVKVAATSGYGGEVVQSGWNYDEAYAEALRIRDEEGMTFIHAFDDEAVIAGQGTIGLELLEQVPGLEAVVIPIGGGGLIGGIGCAIKEINPAVRVVGVEPSVVPSMKEAVSAGQCVTLPPARTIADGIGVRRVGNATLPLAMKYVDEIVTVDEEDIANAILLLLEREKTVAEGAGATSTAALLQRKTSLVGKKTVSLVCGGNIDSIFLSHIIERGLVKDGRIVRLRLQASDHPGVLHAVTGVFAGVRANIVSVQHERAYFGVKLGNTVMDFTLETRGPEHVAEVCDALVAAGYAFERVR
ncbi:threonine ammonia-lyase [Bryobacterales bacterium F-183]|nr:threonine ammonia-lyase [Bryobacterales bacterium F-183]